MRLLHFSDPHYSVVSWHPKQFLSKQWLGNFNLLFSRRKKHTTSHLSELHSLADRLKVDFVIATGDFTATSRPCEFMLAQFFMSQFNQPTLTLPGNHDVYTRLAERTKRYYQYFPSKELASSGVEKKQLNAHWWWIGLDCARANSLWKSNGIFRESMEAPLKAALCSIPAGDSIIVGNHFPLYPSRDAAHDTERSEVLQQILRSHPQVKLYLHGHDHIPYILEGTPLVLNAGCISHLRGGTFYLIDLKENLIQRYARQEKGEWEVNFQASLQPA